MLFECLPENANDLETQMIAWYGSAFSGYNICPQGGSRRGVKLSEETKQKLSDAKKGKSLSSETKKKISDAKKGENNPFYGKTGEKNPNSKLTDIQREEIRNLYATGEYIQAELAKLYSISIIQISRILRKQSSEDYHNNCHSHQ